MKSFGGTEIVKKTGVLTLYAVLVFACLTGCGGSKPVETKAETPATEEVRENTAEEAPAEETETVTPSAQEERVDLGNLTLVDNDEIKIVAKDMLLSETEAMVSVSVENKTAEMGIDIEDGLLNDTEVADTIWVDENDSSHMLLQIAPGESMDVWVRIRNFVPQDSKKIVLSFWCPDSDNLYSSVPIYPYGAEPVAEISTDNPFIEAATDTKTVKVYYDPDVLEDFLGSYGNFISLSCIDWEAVPYDYLFEVYDFDSVEAYAQDRVDSINVTHQDAAASGVQEIQIAGQTVKYFRIDYNVKSYYSDDPNVDVKTMTDEEIEQLDFELKAESKVYNVIELDSGVLLTFQDDLTVPELYAMYETAFQSIKIVVE